MSPELNPRQFDPDVYMVHPKEIGYLQTRDWPHHKLRDRPWRTQTTEAGVKDPKGFDARVKEIMESAKTEGIREPLEVGAGYLHQGHHRWEAARRLDIEVPIKRLGGG